MKTVVCWFGGWGRKMIKWYTQLLVPKPPGHTTSDGTHGDTDVGFLPLLIIVVTLFAYWPTRDFDYVRWDEQLYVMENPFLTDPNGLWKGWITIEKTERQYYPLLLTTFWIEYQLWGENPAGYHAVNLWFHLCNNVLVLFLLMALGASRWVAGAGALLFSLHPIQVESVAWVAELKNLQSGFFYLCAMMIYLKMRAPRTVLSLGQERGSSRTVEYSWNGKGGVAYGVVIFFYLCALLSKTSSVTLPLSLFLIDWLREGESRRWWVGSLWRVGPMLAMGIIPGLISVSLEAGPAPEAIPPLGLRLLIASAAIWFYLYKLVWPVTLVPIYPRWEVAADQWWLWAAGIGLGAVLLFLWYRRRQVDRLVVWGFGHFVASLSPLLGIIPFGYLDHSFVADHFTYLATIGFFLAVVMLAGRLYEGIWKRAGSLLLRRSIATLAAGVILVSMVGLTRQQITIWQNPLSFWSYVTAENPRSSTARNNLGNAYWRLDQRDEAVEHYRQAVQIKPNSSTAHHNIGLFLYEQGHVEEAIEEYREAIFYQPRFWLAHANLAVALAELGQYNAALQSAETALELARERGRTGDAADIETLITELSSHSGSG